ncbi:MAG: ABC transporter ATP-binding protein [Actinomycetota bacterium]
MNKSGHKELRWLLRQMRPLWLLQTVSLICILAGSALTLAGPLVLKWLIDHVLTTHRMSLLLTGTALYAATTAGQLAFTYCGYLLGYRTLETLVFRVRLSRVRRLHNASARYFDSMPVGEVQYRLEQDVDRIGELGSDILPAVLRTAATGTMVLVTMAILNFRLTLLVLPLLPGVYLLQRRYFKRLREAADAAQRTMGGVSSILQEHLLGMVQLQLLNRTAFHGRQLARMAAKGVRARMSQRRAEVEFSAASMALIVIGSATILGYGGREVMQGSLTIGGLVAFYSFVAQLLGPLSSAVDLQSRIQRVGASIRRILEVGEEERIQPATVRDCRNGASAAALEFDCVTFSHRQSQTVLDKMSLTVRQGETIALVGNSGCGKTTIAHLAAGLYHHDEGTIRVQGQLLESVGGRGLRSIVSLVPQHPVLFSATLRENLLYGNPQATDAELAAVINVSQLNDVLGRLPNGLEEHLGVLGKKLSGGEIKRVALARALLRRPEILILDEVTGALDGVTSRALIAALEEFRKGRTTIVISHEPSIMENADRIVVLQHGRVVDHGKHVELVARCNFYQSLVSGCVEAQ